MKTFVYTILIAFLMVPTMLTAQEPSLEKVTLAIKTGNSAALAKHFDSKIEITIMNKEQVYSKAQAEMVVKNFFAKNAPQSFKIIHKGSSEAGSKYGIGTLVTRSGSYRVYLYVKQKDGGFKLQQLRFEND